MPWVKALWSPMNGSPAGGSRVLSTKNTLQTATTSLRGLQESGRCPWQMCDMCKKEAAASCSKEMCLSSLWKQHLWGDALPQQTEDTPSLSCTEQDPWRSKALETGRSVGMCRPLCQWHRRSPRTPPHCSHWPNTVYIQWIQCIQLLIAHSVLYSPCDPSSRFGNKNRWAKPLRYQAASSHSYSLAEVAGSVSLPPTFPQVGTGMPCRAATGEFATAWTPLLQRRYSSALNPSLSIVPRLPRVYHSSSHTGYYNGQFMACSQSSGKVEQCVLQVPEKLSFRSLFSSGLRKASTPLEQVRQAVEFLDHQTHQKVPAEATSKEWSWPRPQRVEPDPVYAFQQDWYPNAAASGFDTNLVQKHLQKPRESK